MANTTVGFDNLAPPKLAPAVGSMTVMCPFKCTVSGTTTSESIVFPNLSVIEGAIVMALSSGNEVATADADVTWSGNTLTLADGSGTFNLDASSQLVYGIVWGKPRA